MSIASLSGIESESSDEDVLAPRAGNSFFHLLLDCRNSEFNNDAERELWRNAYNKLRAQIRAVRGDDVNETVLETPPLAEHPFASAVSGSDGADGLHHVGQSLPPRVRAIRVLFVSSDKWSIATNVALLEAMGFQVTSTSDVARASMIAAPYHRPDEMHRVFDLILYDHRTTTSTARTDDAALKLQTSRHVTEEIQRMHQRQLRQREHEPGSNIDLLAMLRQEQVRKLRGDGKRAQAAAPRLRQATELSDFCLSVRTSDEDYGKRSNFIVRHNIIALVGEQTSAGEAIGSGADLFLRRPLAAHLRTIRRLIMPSHLSNRARNAMAMQPTNFRKMLDLFRTPDVAHRFPPGRIVEDYLPQLNDLVSPNVKATLRSAAEAPDGVPVVVDTTEEEKHDDLLQEVAALKKELSRRDERIAELNNRIQQAAVDSQFEKDRLTRDVRNSQADNAVLTKQLTQIKLELKQLKDQIEREALEAAFAKSHASQLEQSQRGQTLEQLQRRIEYLSSELEKERRMSVARAVRRSHNTSDVQTQAGSGVTVAQFMNGVRKENGVNCDIISTEDHENQSQRIRELETTVRTLRSATSTNVVELSARLDSQNAELLEARRNFETINTRLAAKTSELVKLQTEVSTLKFQLEDANNAVAQATSMERSFRSAPSNMETIPIGLGQSLNALWVTIGLSKVADTDAIEHALRCKDAVQQWRVKSSNAPTVTDDDSRLGSPAADRRLSSSVASAALGPLRGTPKRDSLIPGKPPSAPSPMGSSASLPSKTVRPFGE